MITELRLTVAKTINLGNFQNIKTDAGLTMTVEEGEDFAVLKRRANEEIAKLLAETYRAQVKGGDATSAG